MDKQKTIAAPITASGKGLHTGLNVNLTILPADENAGIRFRRVDLDGKPEVAALAENVVETSRSTVIAQGDARVSTIEHLMAALWGMGIDNAMVEIDAVEVPILDGSAKLWVEEITKVGMKNQDADRKYFDIEGKISYTAENGVELVAFADTKLTVGVNIDFSSKVIGSQYATYTFGDDFASEVASCRTFVFLHDILPLFEANLIKGGDLNNAIVVVEEVPSDSEAQHIEKVFGTQCQEAMTTGYLSSKPLHFNNEIARHKLLDLCGDMALIGRRLHGYISATRPGHKANTEFAKLIRKEIRAAESRPPFKYDPNKAPLMDINAIRNILPHRPPFLLVDKILDLGPEHVVGIKQVTMNEPFFVGHFPSEPVMPGVLMVEAIAQCGGILALNGIPDPENYSTYFMKIDNVKFKRKVVPGDTLMFCLELAEPIRRGIVVMRARAFVGDALAVEAELMAMVSKTKNIQK
ncbi:MAG: bifunctional UDP-3-O-[3-hydroxymyristoyl] N-acetylglucosamine deacetylase/3-hydroxyacyl-ACP dehydratase [Mucinivorans sp.]